jgi:hypothetical protein
MRSVVFVMNGITVISAPFLSMGAVAESVTCRTAQPLKDAQASVVLAEQRPFEPQNRNLFFTYEHPDWATVAPPKELPGPALDEEATREELRVFLERRFPCAADQVQRGLAVYGDPTARQKVPSSTLRAALAALTGTVGEPAIEFLLYRTPVTLIDFGIYVDSATGFPGRVGGAFVSPDGTRHIVIDRRYRFTPFGAFSSLLVHEALHQGADNDNAGLPEEAVASAVEALVYMEMLLTDPTLATLPDELTRANNNHEALVRLNSGQAGSDHLTLFVPEGTTNIDPLSVEPLTEFFEYYARYSTPTGDGSFRERETQGNWLLEQILTLLAGPDGDSPDTAMDFDAETLAYVDTHQAILGPSDLIAVACILGLNVPCD